MRGWVVGITGASGAIYGIRLCEELLKREIPLHIVVTEAGWRVLREELGWQTSQRKEALEAHFAPFGGTYQYHPIADIGASIASGSFRTEGLVVMPCSMGTLSGISRGASDNLLERTADVMLKERRRLILVPRETPLHAIHLENMLSLAKMGVSIIPAMPAFYHGPKSLDDIVGFLVGKVMDNMGIDHQLFNRWGEQANEQERETNPHRTH
ncbi:UbiX family flavin prenyltransferase [Paenibacillus sp. N1-5-1-14]|uniref:UbiX family flavin prenyltransferase n=1 Tax=Paenibacillus radicibacter TaxID=2972488 RepID=UPI002159AEE8|nr:UbiX family flavin prenyltransferase [Paenibacillus radicibacter]MCR8642293.1 UbiX family flavin prenyltransferase [Paenibacillus radicibacter]